MLPGSGIAMLPKWLCRVNDLQLRTINWVMRGGVYSSELKSVELHRMTAENPLSSRLSRSLTWFSRDSPGHADSRKKFKGLGASVALNVRLVSCRQWESLVRFRSANTPRTSLLSYTKGQWNILSRTSVCRPWIQSQLFLRKTRESTYVQSFRFEWFCGVPENKDTPTIACDQSWSKFLNSSTCVQSQNDIWQLLGQMAAKLPGCIYQVYKISH